MERSQRSQRSQRPQRPQQPQRPAIPPRVITWLGSLRKKPKTAAVLIAGVVLAVVAASVAWANAASETWITAAPTQMELSVGTTQPLSVALKYKPHFLGRGSARSIAGTIQLISFPSAVKVAPTTIATSSSAPEATLQVTGLKPGTEELILAASNKPGDASTWQTMSVTVVVKR